MLTDEVWARLDHGAARLPRRQRRRVYLALAALMVLAQLGVVVWASGAVVARVELDRRWSKATVADYTGFSYVIGLRNDGWFPVTVTGWGDSQPGLERVVGQAEVPGFTLRPGQTRDIEVGYRIIACDAVTNDPAPLTVRVARPWGTQTIRLALPRETPPGFSGMWHGEPPLEAHLYWTKVACRESD